MFKLLQSQTSDCSDDLVHYSYEHYERIQIITFYANIDNIRIGSTRKYREVYIITFVLDDCIKLNMFIHLPM